MGPDETDKKAGVDVPATTGSLDPEVVLLRQLGRLPKEDEGFSQTRDSVILSLHAGAVEKLLGQKAEVEKTYSNSQITESRTFSKKEIVEMFVLFAVDKKLDLDTLKVTEVIHDEKGTLIKLEVKAPNHDGTYQLFSFKIKGVLEGRKSLVTGIDFSSFDQDDMPDGGGTIADFRDGKWHTLS